MTNPNQELLDFAVENIEGWDEGYTHLRSDRSVAPLFFTERGEWYICGLNEWTYRGDGTFRKVTTSSDLSTTPQVIAKEEYLEAKGSQALIRDKEYNVKLTGEELVLLTFLLGRTNGNLLYAPYKKFAKRVTYKNRLFVPEFRTADLNSVEPSLKAKLDIIFAPPVAPETEAQRNLRELQEQYQVLGEKIKQMEKGE